MFFCGKILLSLGEFAHPLTEFSTYISQYGTVHLFPPLNVMPTSSIVTIKKQLRVFFALK